MKTFLFFLLIGSVLLAGCQPTTTPTPSRQPEVTVWALQASYNEKKVLTEQADLIQEVNFVWYFLTGNNHINGSNQNPGFVRELQAQGTRVLPAIQNSGFQPEYVHIMVSDPQARAAHIAELVGIAQQEGYDGFDIDYESLYLKDRDDFSVFIEELSAALHQEGKLLSVTVHPKTSDAAAWDAARAQDWARLGAAADYFKIMVYDYSSGPGEAGPVAPVAWAMEVLDYAVSVVPVQKIYLGLPFYGYDYAVGGKRSLTWVGTQAIISRYNGVIQRDESNEAWFTYELGGLHTVFINDALATETKVRKAFDRYPELAGVCIWVLGGEDPENWTVLRDIFIKKVEP